MAPRARPLPLLERGDRRRSRPLPGHRRPPPQDGTGQLPHPPAAAPCTDRHREPRPTGLRDRPRLRLRLPLPPHRTAGTGVGPAAPRSRRSDGTRPARRPQAALAGDRGRRAEEGSGRDHPEDPPHRHRRRGRDATRRPSGRPGAQCPAAGHARPRHGRRRRGSRPGAGRRLDTRRPQPVAAHPSRSHRPGARTPRRTGASPRCQCRGRRHPPGPRRAAR